LKASGIECHQHEPAAPERKKRRYEDLVPGLLRGLKAGRQAFRQQGWIMAGEPHADRESDPAQLCQEQPAGGPPRGSGRPEQQHGQGGDPDDGPGNQFRNQDRSHREGKRSVSDIRIM
jgi:hypothetical protein